MRLFWKIGVSSGRDRPWLSRSKARKTTRVLTPKSSTAVVDRALSGDELPQKGLAKAQIEQDNQREGSYKAAHAERSKGGRGALGSIAMRYGVPRQIGDDATTKRGSAEMAKPVVKRRVRKRVPLGN